jgi:hypothetical protein
MLKQPGHFTSMKNELGDCTSLFSLCFRFSSAGNGLRRSFIAAGTQGKGKATHDQSTRRTPSVEIARSGPRSVPDTASTRSGTRATRPSPSTKSPTPRRLHTCWAKDSRACDVRAHTRHHPGEAPLSGCSVLPRPWGAKRSGLGPCHAPWHAAPVGDLTTARIGGPPEGGKSGKGL